MREYKREGYTLRKAEHSRGEGRAYTVLLPDGTEAGRVETYMATMEQRSPGKRYVNRRWQSERWCARRAGTYRWWWHAWETPGKAAEYLIRDIQDRP